MADSAQDYTYEVTNIDSSNLATITMTSYDSLQYFTGMRVDASTTDSDVSRFVVGKISDALAKWSDQRATSSITVGSATSMRYRTRIENSEPYYNPLTHKLVSSETIDSDTITVNYTPTALSDSEKSIVYSNLTTAKDVLWTNLLEGGHVDSVAGNLNIDDPVSSRPEIEVRFANTLGFYDSSLQFIQSLLSLADSDLAALMVE
jgi:hypothetical protein